MIDEEYNKIIKQIDFEEKWLINIKMDNGFISIADIEISMSGIRSVISELKNGNKKECSTCKTEQIMIAEKIARAEICLSQSRRNQ